jgi:hypothetical protein
MYKGVQAAGRERMYAFDSRELDYGRQQLSKTEFFVFFWGGGIGWARNPGENQLMIAHGGGGGVQEWRYI